MKVVTYDPSKVSGADFFRAMHGLPPMDRAEVAERQARAARCELLIVLEKVEFARANRERELMIRERIRDGIGEDYDAYLERINRPFTEARERVNAKLAEFDRKAAA